jgi:hypothetical protein
MDQGDISMRYTVRAVFSAVALMSALSFGFCRPGYAGEMKRVQADSNSMELRHMNTMMAHGLWMVTEGFAMVMLAEMKMVPSVDPATSDHGRRMIRSGKEVIEHFMSGPQMKELHKTGHADDPLMKYSHELGEAIMKATIIMERITTEGAMASGTMSQHHVQLIVSHALSMAAEGYSMASLGQMRMSMPVDKFSIGEGQMMMTEARWLLQNNFEGGSMKEMQKKGLKSGSGMMAETRKLREAATRVIDLLEKMPSASSK